MAWKVVAHWVHLDRPCQSLAAVAVVAPLELAIQLLPAPKLELQELGRDWAAHAVVVPGKLLDETALA